MTLPEQSERAVAATREFLVRLSSPFVEGGIKGIRREVRTEALALLRHYPYAWNGDCPEQDNAANEDNLLAEVRRLRSAIAALADQDATLSVCEGSVIVTMDATLTVEERAAVSRDLSWLQWCEDNNQIGDVGRMDIATLRGLLERMA